MPLQGSSTPERRCTAFAGARLDNGRAAARRPFSISQKEVAAGGTWGANSRSMNQSRMSHQSGFQDAIDSSARDADHNQSSYRMLCAAPEKSCRAPRSTSAMVPIADQNSVGDVTAALCHKETYAVQIGQAPVRSVTRQPPWVSGALRSWSQTPLNRVTPFWVGCGAVLEPAGGGKCGLII